ncbi:MAG: fibronectin type III domain-containing protein, partial [bacterium]|nr:fibronectin type III domain-containing protein [bacterium]
WHYPASGWMNYSAMVMDSYSHDNPATGSSCVKITYDPAKADWAGFYAQASAQWGGQGLDMSNYSAMLIRARAGDSNASAIQVQFGVGGDSGDTCNVKTNFMVLTNEWQTYAIDLTNKNLTNINGLLLVVMRPAVNIDPSFYIDDIKFIGPGPAAITDLNTTLGSTPGSVNLTWTAPAGDYINNGYVVRFADNYDFNNATVYGQSWIPGTPGTPESHAVAGLIPGQGYYFAVQTMDDHGNLSGLSNVVFVIARTAGIGITVEGTIDLGLMMSGETKIGTEPIIVTNIGGEPVTLTLNLEDPPGWQAAPTPGMNQYALLGAFGSTSGAVIWNVNNHLLTAHGIKCTNAIYAGDQNGVGVAVNAQRKLWLRLTTPLGIDVGTEKQIITISVTAGTAN